jgi:hypothetical protein
LPSLTKISRAPANLDRLLLALEGELLQASDAEILRAAEELGMKPSMKGSAAFLGLKSALPKRLEDFFDLDSLDESTRAKILQPLKAHRKLKGSRSEEK